MAFQIVRYKHAKLTFELMTNPGSVRKWRKQEISNINDVIQSDIIFKNQSKAEKANAADLSASFGTEVVDDCIKVILQKGEVQLTSAERKEKVDKKRLKIVNYIHKYYVDPRSKLPHPVVRIDAALTEAKIRVDADQKVESQIQEILKKMPGILTLKKCEIIGVLSIPSKYVGAASGVIHKYVTVNNERYTATECVMEVSLVPGDYDGLLTELQNVTKGEYQFDVEGGGGTTTVEEVPANKKGGKGGKQPAKKGGNNKRNNNNNNN